MKDFDGKVAVITGGASGIGLGMARAFAGAGMKLVLADLDEVALDTVASELQTGGADVVTRLCDVSQYDQVEALADLAVDSTTRSKRLPTWPSTPTAASIFCATTLVSASRHRRRR